MTAAAAAARAISEDRGIATRVPVLPPCDTGQVSTEQDSKGQDGTGQTAQKSKAATVAPQAQLQFVIERDF